MENKIVVVIFSKNRAAQLDLCLKTFFKYSDGNYLAIKVLYKTDEKHKNSYKTLDDKYGDDVVFIEEIDFKMNLLSIVAGFNKVLFVCDDCIFTSRFNLHQCSDIMDYYPGIIGVSLRLGTNTSYCYSMNGFQGIPRFTQRYSGKYQDFLEYEWPTAIGDFSYSLELSSSLYRVSNLSGLLGIETYSNPNDLEWKLYINLSKFVRWPHLVCYEKSVAFCNPINKVQTVNNNRAGNYVEYSADELLNKFEQDYRIDERPFDGFVSNAAHQEIKFDFYKIGEE